MKKLKFEQEILDSLLDNSDISDISYNGKNIYIQDTKKGRYKLDSIVNFDDIENYIKQLTYLQNKEFNTENPILDLDYNNLRITANHHSIVDNNITTTIRKSVAELRIKNEEDLGNKDILEFLKQCIKANSNILISGKTGAGKTELQKSLVKYINNTDKIIVIEDVFDTHLNKIYKDKDIMSWKINTKLDNPIDFDKLIKASLRNNPDWIIISEVRSYEAYSMLKSALSGHNIITTMHSNSAKNNVDRLIYLCKEKFDLDQVLLGKMVTDVFDLGIHLDYDITDNGVERFIVEVVEYIDYDINGVKYNSIFKREFKIKYNSNLNKYEYIPYFKYNTISEKLFQKLLNQKCITQNIFKFLEREMLQKYEEN